MQSKNWLRKIFDFYSPFIFASHVHVYPRVDLSLVTKIDVVISGVRRLFRSIIMCARVQERGSGPAADQASASPRCLCKRVGQVYEG